VPCLSIHAYGNRASRRLWKSKLRRSRHEADIDTLTLLEHESRRCDLHSRQIDLLDQLQQPHIAKLLQPVYRVDSWSERHLLYMACTRVRDHLLVSGVRRRKSSSTKWR
jgi:hypothetical protein